MTTKKFIESIETTYQKGLEIIKAKNHDYASDVDPFRNFRYAQYVNLTVEDAILVRVSDKFARLCNLIKKGDAQVKDETLSDTLTDMINYLAILKAYIEDKN